MIAFWFRVNFNIHFEADPQAKAIISRAPYPHTHPKLVEPPTPRYAYQNSLKMGDMLNSLVAAVQVPEALSSLVFFASGAPPTCCMLLTSASGDLAEASPGADLLTAVGGL